MKTPLNDVVFASLLIVMLILQDTGMIHASNSMPGQQQNAKSMQKDWMAEYEVQ